LLPKAKFFWGVKNHTVSSLPALLVSDHPLPLTLPVATLHTAAVTKMHSFVTVLLCTCTLFTASSNAAPHNWPSVSASAQLPTNFSETISMSFVVPQMPLQQPEPQPFIKYVFGIAGGILTNPPTGNHLTSSVILETGDEMWYPAGKKPAGWRIAIHHYGEQGQHGFSPIMGMINEGDLVTTRFYFSPSSPYGLYPRRATFIEVNVTTSNDPRTLRSVSYLLNQQLAPDQMLIAIFETSFTHADIPCADQLPPSPSSFNWRYAVWPNINDLNFVYDKGSIPGFCGKDIKLSAQGLLTATWDHH